MKNKVLSILFIFIFISLIFINNSFAANTVEVTGIEDEALFDLIYQTDEYKSGNYYLVVGRNDISYYKIIFLEKTEDLKVYIDNFSGGNYGVNYSAKTNEIIYRASQNPTELVLAGTGFMSSNLLYNSGSGEFYSSFNIYADNTYTDFFIEAPAQGILALILEHNNPTKTFQTMIRGTIPYLIVFLVGLVAFWKAWRFLFKELRKA